MDQYIEKIVFLFNAHEGNYGLYELVWELGIYEELDIYDKYKVAKNIILDLINSKFAIIQTYLDKDYRNRDKVIESSEINMFLNNPCNWYPFYPPFPCLELTTIGEVYLTQEYELNKSKIETRLFGNQKIT